MRADQLWVFTARSNPLRWKAPHANWEKFATQILAAGAHLVVVECAYGREDFACLTPPMDPAHKARFHHVGVRAKTRGWIKENALNVGIRHYPEAEYIGWFDADILFENQNFAEATVSALQHYDVVQPWEHCLDLGPNGELLKTHTSFCRQHFLRQPTTGPKTHWTWGGGRYDFPHPGYAWAMTRQAYEWVGGLLDIGAMGSGDHHMSLSLIGEANASMPPGTHPNYRAGVKLWEKRAVQHIAGNIGHVPGIIRHLFHGKKEQRGYESRWDMFLRHGFDPTEDLKMNGYGIYEFALNKPELRHDFDLYLHSRNEDGSL